MQKQKGKQKSKQKGTQSKVLDVIAQQKLKNFKHLELIQKINQQKNLKQHEYKTLNEKLVTYRKQKQKDLQVQIPSKTLIGRIFGLKVLSQKNQDQYFKSFYLLSTMTQDIYRVKMNLSSFQWNKLCQQYQQKYKIRWQSSKIISWGGFINSYTSSQAQSTSINQNVKLIYLKLIGVISSYFLVRDAHELSILLLANLKYQYPLLNSYSLLQKSLQIYQNQQAYNTLFLFNKLKTQNDTLSFENIEIEQRPKNLYAFAQSFVMNFATTSPVQAIQTFMVQKQQIKLMIQYQFDILTRSISNCKLTLGQHTVSYFINQTDVLWDLSEKLFKTKMQYEQKTVK